MTDYAIFEEQFNDRLSQMVSSLESFSIPRLPPFATVHYLKSLLDSSRGRLSGLKVKVDESAAPSPARMSYELESTPKLLHLNHRLIDGFDKAKEKFGEELLPGVIDCFLVHELLHYSQGMGYGRYSGLSEQAPNTLLMLDYQADAMAVVAISHLALWSPFSYAPEVTADKHGLWETYSNSIRYALGQMEVFTHFLRKDMERTKVSEMHFSLDKLQRTMIWQYQYHRVLNFNRERPLGDFQIMSQPSFHFRNLEAAWAQNENYLKKNWPTVGEQAFRKSLLPEHSGYKIRSEKDPFCIFAAASQFGTTRFVRCSTDNLVKVELFRALFDGSLDRSKSFFDPLFQDNPWLIGKPDKDDPDNPGDDGGSPSSQPPIPQDSGRLVRDLDNSGLTELLMYGSQTTSFPLTTMVKTPEFT